MFFPRLRRQAKWMFVFLALVFGLGFVIFGVGSNAPSGLGDVLNFGGAAAAGPSVSDAREKIERNPRNAAAHRELADALIADGRSDEAIVALERYLRLRPRDADALRQLGGLHIQKATTLGEQAQLAQLEAQTAQGGAFFGQPLPTQRPAERRFAESLQRNPITETMTARATERAGTAYTRTQTAYSEAKEVFVRLAALAGDDPQVQLQLAEAAQLSGDTETAITAYRRFVRLAPDDPLARDVRAQIKRLQAPTPTASG